MAKKQRYQSRKTSSRGRQKKQEKIEARKKAEREKKIKSAIIWSAAIFLVVGVFGAIVYFGQSSEDVRDYSLDEVGDFEWTKGNSEAEVVLVEYSDFECPACAFYYPLTKQLAEEFEDDILFVYRHFPLRQIHRNAEDAAVAAEAAGNQGMFWEMHDILFDKQEEWEEQGNADELFVSYAEELELDMEQFERDFEDRDLLQKVRQDYASGTKAGVNGTPSFFLNGEKIQNPNGYEELRDLVTEALQNN